MYAVYGAHYCPYCHKAVEVINNFTSQNVEIIEIDSIPIALDQMLQAKNHNTIPVIFDNDRFVGGLVELCDELGINLRRSV